MSFGIYLDIVQGIVPYAIPNIKGTERPRRVVLQSTEVGDQSGLIEHLLGAIGRTRCGVENNVALLGYVNSKTLAHETGWPILHTK